MVRNDKFIVTIILFLIAANVQAQVNRYVVYFPDKEDTNYRIDQPLEFLSQKAIDRRVKVGFEITEQDFPVNRNYIDSLVKYNANPYYTSRWFNAAIIQVDVTVKDLLLGKSFVTSVEYVAPGVEYTEVPSEKNTSYTSNPPVSDTKTTDRQLSMLAVDYMHQDGYTGEGLWIAVFDGGFAGANESSVFQNLFENNKIKDMEDFVSGGKDVFIYDDHGTKVLSCISGKYNSQIVGTAYDAEISLYITGDDAVYEDEFRIEEFNWVIAAEKADSSGVDIISSSLGYNTFEDSSMDYTTAQLDGKTAIVTKGAEMVSDRGVLVVNSAGNSGGDSWNLITFPADGESVLAVGGVTSSKVRSDFSSFGPTADNRIKPDVAAMATGTVVVNSQGNIVSSNGTSFACPLVAGFAASLWQAKPELTNIELKQLIMTSSSQANNPDNSLGYGIPNYNVAVGNILGLDNEMSKDVHVYPNPITGNKLKVKFDIGQFGKSLAFEIYNSNGNMVVSDQKQILHSDNEIELDLTGLTKGIYILSIISPDNYKGIKLLKF
ncbi:S8 family serine peptidase [Reichenbachiella sp. MALMAid0571]|uniref:S8 family serine peptidase n=1 Tax=Reichenbachiella sp. MALMAid0571 TaxID=3143939 RepID=UPI0032DFC242